MSDDQNIQDQVRGMAKLSLLSNKINEIQVRNLKMYPLVFFENVESAAVDYDFSNTGNIDFETDPENLEVKYNISKPERSHFRVTYKVALNEEGNDHLDKRFDAITKAVRSLFWKDTKIQVYFNDKLVFESEANV